MKRLSIACVAAAALVGPVCAADLPSRKMAPAFTPVAYVPAFTWTGFYVGGNLGYHWGGGDGNSIGYYSPTPGVQADLMQSVALGWLPTKLGGSQDGFTAGAQAGYNYQFNSFVIGVEGDINWVGGGKTSNAWYISTGATAGDWAGYGSASSGLSWLGTVRARLGFAVDHFLFYGTGGFAFGNSDSSFGLATTDYRFDPARNYGWYGSKSDTAVGWTLGGGVEFAFTNNWTAKIEYLYYDLGDQSYTVASPQTTDIYAVVKHQQTGSILRTGLNYKF